MLCYVQVSRLLFVLRLGVGERVGGTLARQTESVAHLLAHVGVSSSFVVGHSLDTSGALGDLVSGRQLSVLNLEHVSRVLFRLLRPDVSVLENE